MTEKRRNFNIRVYDYEKQSVKEQEKKYADDFKKFKSEMDSQNDAKMKTLLNELITLEAKDFCTKIDGKWYVNFGTVH